MSCRVLESCIGCDMCVLECPNDAITEKDGVYTINEDLLHGVRRLLQVSQCMRVCAVKAIARNPERRESHDELLAKARRIHSVLQK